MNKKEFLNKLDAILNESKQHKGNYQIQTELFDKLQDVADEYGFDTFMQEYRTEYGIYLGTDLFDIALDTIQSTNFKDFSTIVENASVLNQFGERTELMELWITINDYQEINALDFVDNYDVVDALKFEINN